MSNQSEQTEPELEPLTHDPERGARMYHMSKQTASPSPQRPSENSPPAGFNTLSSAAAATAAAVISQYKTRAGTSQTGSPLAEAVAGGY
jgi:hypothetical protein